MLYPEILALDSTEYFQDFNRQIADHRIPVQGSLELTFRCNLRCVHCYCNLPAGDRDAAQEELGTKEVLSLLDRIAEAGCLWLLLTGGEPLLRQDLFEIYTHAKKKGFLITLFTNGTLITPQVLDMLAEWPPRSIEITLYGATRETCEAVTRVPGSFHQCMAGIEKLLEKGLPLALKTMAMTLNHHEIPQMMASANERGLKFRFDPILNPRIDRSKDPCRFRLPPEEVIRLVLAHEERSNEWQEFCKKFIFPPSSESLFGCGAGIRTFNVDPYGKMSPCQMARFQVHDLRKASFKEVWGEHIPATLKMKPQGDYPCGRCDPISLCGQCSGWAWLENRDLEKPVDYLCRIAHLRAAAFR